MRNRSCFGLFRFEPKYIFVCFEDTLVESLPGSQTGRSPAPTLPWGQWASLRYTSFAGGRGSYGFQELICDVNSSACCAYISSFYTFRVYLLPTATFSWSFSCTFLTSTPTFICGRMATFSRPFSCTFLYIHAYIHLWTHSDISILRLHSSTSLFYAYTHLWVYSGLYSARRL